MTATMRSARRTRGAVLAVALTFLVVLPAAPAHARPAGVEAQPAFFGIGRQHTYVAFGDSFAAGVGVQPYEQGTEGDAACRRSASGSYPELLGAALNDSRSERRQLDVRSSACTGAEIDDVLTRPRGDEPPQLDVYRSLTAERDPGRSFGLVTVMIGGNDLRLRDPDGNELNFAGVLRFCAERSARQEDPCADVFDGQVPDVLDELEPRLAETYGEIRATTPGLLAGWRVHAVTYPQFLAADPADLLPTEQCSDQLYESDRAWARAQLTALNETVTSAARTAGVRTVNTEDAFAGREMCTPDALIAPPDSPEQAAALHPNAAGHERLAEAVRPQLHWLVR